MTNYSWPNIQTHFWNHQPVLVLLPGLRERFLHLFRFFCGGSESRTFHHLLNACVWVSVLGGVCTFDAFDSIEVVYQDFTGVIEVLTAACELLGRALSTSTESGSVVHESILANRRCGLA